MEYGARPDELVPDWDSTAIHQAVLYGKWDLVEHFVELGADINVEDNEGQTPLDRYLANPGLDEERRAWLRKLGAVQKNDPAA